MHMDKLLAVAIMCSLVGILIIAFVGENNTPKLIEISKINKDLIGENIRIKGEITKFSRTEDVSFLIVKDNTNSISVVAFGNLTLKKGDMVEVEGGVEEYKDSLEILAELIKVA